MVVSDVDWRWRVWVGDEDWRWLMTQIDAVVMRVGVEDWRWLKAQIDADVRELVTQIGGGSWRRLLGDGWCKIPWISDAD